MLVSCLTLSKEVMHTERHSSWKFLIGSLLYHVTQASVAPCWFLFPVDVIALWLFFLVVLIQLVLKCSAVPKLFAEICNINKRGIFGLDLTLTYSFLCCQKQTEPNVRNKILYLIQAWAQAFRNEPKYKVVQDTYQIMKVEGKWIDKLYFSFIYCLKGMISV